MKKENPQSPTPPSRSAITHVKKRDGGTVFFDPEKITNAVFKATVADGKPDRTLAQRVSDKVVEKLEKNFAGKIPHVEEIQDLVEQSLIELGESAIAKRYIVYRQERKLIRDVKQVFYGVTDDLKLTLNAVKVLERRYLMKDDTGRVVETPKQMFRRVARAIAIADFAYDPNANVEKTEKKFYNMMSRLEFMPNSPTLMNAGIADSIKKEYRPEKFSFGQLSACFVIPVEDDLGAIFDAVKNMALIQQSGGGTGYAFSRLRPRNDIVFSTKGEASGPVSFMAIFDKVTDTVKQGGRRRGANMGVLRIDHPDVLEFITCKADGCSFPNFNISVAVTEAFMQALGKKEYYDLINPRNKKAVGQLYAPDLFNLLVKNAWASGDPGVIFIDRVNALNPTQHIGEIEATNPCGEQPLHGFESCNLGSINLAKFVRDGEMDWDRLADVVNDAVHFLDNVIDMNRYPIPKIEHMTKANRRIGLGVMGFADMLILLGVPYSSEQAVTTAEKIMKFIQEESKKASVQLARERGSFPNFKGSLWEKAGYKEMRNATTTTIAPTGTLSIIVDCSSGIEPLFAISFVRNVMDNTQLLESNKYFREIATREGFYSEELMYKVAQYGSIQHIKEVPDYIRAVFLTAHDIPYEWHIKIQAAFQKYTDNAVSKTINFPHDATIEDVRNAYLLAYSLGCKGITVFRDKSKGEQVLNIGVTPQQVGEVQMNAAQLAAEVRRAPVVAVQTDSAGDADPPADPPAKPFVAAPALVPPRAAADPRQTKFTVDAEYAGGGCKTCKI